MKEVPIAATRRSAVGKGSARRERQAGNIPAVVYGPEIQPTPVSVREKDLRAALKTSGGISALFKLQVDDSENMVILRDIQRDPVTSRIVHIDFHAVSMTKPISISIPVRFVGTPRGVKTDGGIMQVTMRDLDVSCLPADIPEQLEINVEDLGIGDSIHVRDISVPKAEILSPERRTIVVIAAPTVIKAETAAAVEEEAEEAEAAEGEEAPAETEESSDQSETK